MFYNLLQMDENMAIDIIDNTKKIREIIDLIKKFFVERGYEIDFDNRVGYCFILLRKREKWYKNLFSDTNKLTKNILVFDAGNILVEVYEKHKDEVVNLFDRFAQIHKNLDIKITVVLNNGDYY